MTEPMVDEKPTAPAEKRRSKQFDDLSHRIDVVEQHLRDCAEQVVQVLHLMDEMTKDLLRHGRMIQRVQTRLEQRFGEEPVNCPRCGRKSLSKVGAEGENKCQFCSSRW